MSSILSMPDISAGAPPPTIYGGSLGTGGLMQNPQLPQSPLGQYTDSQYEAAAAQLRQQIVSQYNDILQQLGYTNDQGQYVPGTVETQANRQLSDLNRSSDLATEDVTNAAQQAGNLFSGYRATQTARAQFPFQQAIAQMQVDVPKQLTDLYGQAAGLVNQFSTQNNMLLADAAARQSANLQQQAYINALGNSGGGGYVAPTVPTPSGGDGGTSGSRIGTLVNGVPWELTVPASEVAAEKQKYGIPTILGSNTNTTPPPPVPPAPRAGTAIPY